MLTHPIIVGIVVVLSTASVIGCVHWGRKMYLFVMNEIGYWFIERPDDDNHETLPAAVFKNREETREVAKAVTDHIIEEEGLFRDQNGLLGDIKDELAS